MGTSLLDPSSAIDQLLGQLVPGTTPSGPPQMPQAQASPLPQTMNGPTAQSLLGNAPGLEHPGVLHRVVSNLLGIPGAISNQIRPNAPAGTQSLIQAGLITPDEADAARPSLLRTLIHPENTTASEMYANNLSGVLGAHQTIIGVQEHTRQLQAMRDMAQLYPQPQQTGDPVKDRQNMQQWLGDQYGYAISHNLPDIAKEMGSNLRGVMSAPLPPPKGVTLGPGQTLVDPVTGKPIASNDASKQYEPKPYTLPNGQSIWVAPGSPVPAGAKPLSTTNTEIHVDAAAAGRDDATVNRYISQIAPLRQRAQAIEQAMMTVDQAKNSPDPNERHALYSSALANFIQAADQKAQLRYQILNYFKENINASAEGRWELLKNRVINGQLPDATMEGMLTHLTNLRNLTYSEIESQRNDLVRRKPGMQTEAPLTNSFFPSMSSAPPSSATPSNTAGPTGTQRKITTKSGKTFVLPP